MMSAKKQRITRYLLGAVGIVLLVVMCALMPSFALWANEFPPVLVYLGLFIIMMIAGSLLNKGFTQIQQDILLRKMRRVLEAADDVS